MKILTFNEFPNLNIKYLEFKQNIGYKINFVTKSKIFTCYELVFLKNSSLVSKTKIRTVYKSFLNLNKVVH